MVPEAIIIFVFSIIRKVFNVFIGIFSLKIFMLSTGYDFMSYFLLKFLMVWFGSSLKFSKDV